MATSLSTNNPRECFPSNDSDDDESFVVLSSSQSPDFLNDDSESERVQLVNTEVINEAAALTESAISQLMASASSLPTMPTVAVKKDASILSTSSETATSVGTVVSSEFSSDEIQHKVDLLIEENKSLKDTLHQNNLAMKKQYDTLVMWQDDVLKVHKSHKEKFAETKQYIDKLKIENAKLLDALSVSESTNEALKEQQTHLKAQIMQFENSKEESYQNNFSLLQNSLSNVKEFEAEAAKNKQRELENTCASLVSEKFELQQNNEQLLNRLEATAKVAEERAEEIKKLTDLLEAKNGETNYQELYKNVQEQLMAAQMHITKLELCRNEDREVINSKVTDVQQLQDLIKEMTINNDGVEALHQQIDAYKADFDAECAAKNAITVEKDKIADDLRHLQRRNQQLLEEVERLRGSDFVHVVQEEQATKASAPPNDVPSAKYMCPKCQFRFRDYNALENHVFRCIDLDDFP